MGKGDRRIEIDAGKVMGWDGRSECHCGVEEKRGQQHCCKGRQEGKGLRCFEIEWSMLIDIQSSRKRPVFWVRIRLNHCPGT